MAKQISTILMKDLPIKQTSITDDDYVVVSSGGTKKLKIKDITKDVEKKAANLEEKTTELGSQLEHKANKEDVNSKIWSMANMGQDVKEAMTGGSVAVVGENAVLTENIVDKQISIEKLSNTVFEDFNGYKVTTLNASSTSDIALATKVSFDMQGIDLTNKTIEVKYDFYSEDTNITGVNAKLIQGNTLGGYTGTSKTGTKVLNDSKKYITYSNNFTFTTTSNFLTLFIMPNFKDATKETIYYISNVKIIIDNTVFNYKNIGKHNQTNYVITGIKNLPNQLLPKVQFNELFEENFSVKTEKYDCFSFRALAKQNSVNIQPVFLFDLESVGDLILDDEFTLSFTFKNNSTNIKSFKLEFYFNNTSVAGSLGGVSYKPSSTTSVDNEISINFKGLIKSIDYKFLHVFITFEVFDASTITNFDIIKPTLVINNKEANRIDSVILYGTSELEEIVYKEFNDNQIVTIGYLKNNSTNSHYEGKKWNILGDSITKGYGTTITYHDYISKKYNIINRNYGIVGTNIAGGTTQYGDSMVDRYVNMNTDADLITVFGGTNDFTNNIPLGTIDSNDKNTFYGALNILMKGLSEMYIGKGILFITPFNYKDTPNSNGNTLQEFVKAIKDCGNKYSIPVFDAYANSGLLTVNSTIRPGIAIDTKHLNENGHAILATRIEPIVLSLINTFI